MASFYGRQGDFHYGEYYQWLRQSDDVRQCVEAYLRCPLVEGGNRKRQCVEAYPPVQGGNRKRKQDAPGDEDLWQQAADSLPGGDQAVATFLGEGDSDSLVSEDFELPGIVVGDDSAVCGNDILHLQDKTPCSWHSHDNGLCYRLYPQPSQAESVLRQGGYAGLWRLCDFPGKCPCRPSPTTLHNILYNQMRGWTTSPDRVRQKSKKGKPANLLVSPVGDRKGYFAARFTEHFPDFSTSGCLLAAKVAAMFGGAKNSDGSWMFPDPLIAAQHILISAIAVCGKGCYYQKWAEAVKKDAAGNLFGKDGIALVGYTLPSSGATVQGHALVGYYLIVPTKTSGPLVMAIPRQGVRTGQRKRAISKAAEDVCFITLSRGGEGTSGA